MTATAPSLETPPPAQVRLIDATTPIDTLVFEEDPPWYDLPYSTQQSLTDELVRSTFDFHRDNCEIYARYVEQELGSGPLDAIERIPLVSTRVFKFSSVLSVAEDAVEQWYLSSGTSGVPSRVPRDRRSLERLVGSVRSTVGLLDDWHEDGVAVVNLGPGREFVNDVWFQYVMSLIETVYETESIVPGDAESLHRISRLCDERLGQYDNLVVVGPPFHVLSLCESIEARERPVDGGARTTVLTAGGWKRFSGRAIEKPLFRERVRRAFGLASENQVRDAFNQVELNSVLFECSAHEKHVPPWVHAAARDPDTLLPVADGEPGMMSYLDASCTAFPCFILTEDLGVVRRGTCGCGREGVRVEVLRRLESRAAKGCALKMGQIHAAEQRK